jgi:two-component system, chemotaxis family, sensor kinase CheA
MVQHHNETVQNIFSAAHTLKGSSASMGFEKMREFTHHLENTFEQIRQQKLAVTSE